MENMDFGAIYETMHNSTSDYDSLDMSLGSVMVSSTHSSLNGHSNDITLERQPESLTNGYANTLSPGYYSGYMKASSPTPSWYSRKSRSPAPSCTGSWRQQRMHEGYSLPLDEFRMAAMQGNLPVVKSLLQQ
ncbi:hypothetical protein SK128_026388, partial [Halocaridina rubra]